MSSIIVSNVSPDKTEADIRDFFSFCGKITAFTAEPIDEVNKTLSAKVTFERQAAAKTAVLLNSSLFGANQVSVTLVDDGTGLAEEPKEGHSEHLAQEDKPRTAIFAEYLSHGYVIGDNTLHKAIELDNQHGFSARFIAFLKSFDDKYKATDKAKSVDTSYGVTDKATTGWNTLNQYFEKAIGTPTGQKVRTFYTQGSKQVMDIHTEARRLADMRKEKEEKPSEAHVEKA